MVYQIKYGEKQFLRYGRISNVPTVYLHPSTVNAAKRNFERRFPQRAGTGKILCFERNKAVKVCDEVL